MVFVCVLLWFYFIKGHIQTSLFCSYERKRDSFFIAAYAVATNGRPVTFDVYRGGLVDAKELKKIIKFLKDCGMGIKGVILDRGYCNAKAIEYLDQEKIAYIIMVKGQPQGFIDTVEEYAQKIKMNVDWLIEGTYLFGIQKRCMKMRW